MRKFLIVQCILLACYFGIMTGYMHLKRVTRQTSVQSDDNALLTLAEALDRNPYHF